MLSAKTKRNLISKLNAKNLKEYAKTQQKLRFIANLIGGELCDLETQWLDAQFYDWALDLELL